MTSLSSSRRQAFRKQVAAKQALLVPGAFNAMSARVIEDLGFQAVYLTGAGVTNMSFGLPDLGFIGLSDIAEHTARIRDAVALPMIVDADTGFGNALNVQHAVRTLERAGADAIQLEDQVMPKKCGHFAGKHVVSTSEMVAKIRAAADARQDDAFQIIARTDAAAVHGIEDAIDRGHRFAEAGADILFLEAIEDLPDIERLPGLFQIPLLINIVIGGKTPVQDRDALQRLGYGLVLYANAALQGAVRGMQQALGQLQSNGQMNEDPAIVAPFSERQRLVRKPLYDELDARYKSDD
ncbi:Phosphoenolpyruvate phosphomutase [Cupriavidus sp. OV038]|jgi:2-methylisocitrate lyase-like PEP mutase family enzyme|uniref:isocitrate lyase/PEP mutase family protein n=1 Tax=unclassified Cupriavidus TaxID=2640874 RepID=UPI0008E77DD5|nr:MULTISPECIES: oxaloacetate decarboxylase [unclassified Cupriavidus]SFC37000.1 Phosphoenolpyruvate phosphomutase [Cupriavidus sp. OV038]SFP27961.1 Phosphoenolpyruvate phosphomutase [Cupriavidus sp. OV096]